MVPLLGYLVPLILSPCSRRFDRVKGECVGCSHRWIRGCVNPSLWFPTSLTSRAVWEKFSIPGLEVFWVCWLAEVCVNALADVTSGSHCSTAAVSGTCCPLFTADPFVCVSRRAMPDWVLQSPFQFIQLTFCSSFSSPIIMFAISGLGCVPYSCRVRMSRNVSLIPSNSLILFSSTSFLGLPSSFLVLGFFPLYCLGFSLL